MTMPMAMSMSVCMMMVGGGRRGDGRDGRETSCSGMETVRGATEHVIIMMIMTGGEEGGEIKSSWTRDP